MTTPWPMLNAQTPQLPASCTLPSMKGITSEASTVLEVTPMEPLFAPRVITLSDIESCQTIDCMH
jgi:hypothetical protein